MDKLELGINMKTTALRLYGKNDLRLESFELPEIKEDELLADVVTNSICMSSYKAVIQGSDHKRVPADVAQNPVIVGHEMCGTILKVGEKFKNKYSAGTKYTIQPALNYPGREPEAPGYSFPFFGGNATKIIIPKEALEMDCVIPCYGNSFFKVSLAEPIACLLGAFKEQFHYKRNQYNHEMGIKENGNLAILGGAGPMGLAAIDILSQSKKKPRRILITDINQERLDFAEKLFPPEKIKKAAGIEILFINTSTVSNSEILSKTDNKGFDDVFILVPIKSLVAQAGELMAIGGCLNFFAGPSATNFSAEINFYDVHYNRHHIIGSAGSNSDDLREAVEMIDKDVLNPAIMITHIGGLGAAADTIQNLPDIPGGKKLIYTNISLPLTALENFEEKGKTDPLFKKLAQIVKKNNGLWSEEAEVFLLKNATPN
jgi:threonine dehydrogenase-like Zn-dependent dehydrogenase